MAEDDCTPSSLNTAVFVSRINEDRSALCMLVIATACSLGVFAQGFVQFYYVWRYLTHPWIRGNIAFLVALFPICTACSIVAMYVPTAGNLLFTFSYSYAIICLYRLVSVIKDSFGSWEAASASLYRSGTRIHFRVAPVCCCMPCLPTVEPSVRNLRILDMITLQGPIFRILVMVVNFTLQTETVDLMQLWFPISTGIVTGSLLLSVFSCHALCKLSLEKLGPFRFHVIYRIVDTTQAFYGLQSLVLYGIAAGGKMPCGVLLTPTDKVFWYNHFMLICECFLLQIIITLTVNPWNSTMFDLHPDSHETALEIGQYAECRRCTVANITVERKVGFMDDCGSHCSSEARSISEASQQIQTADVHM